MAGEVGVIVAIVLAGFAGWCFIAGPCKSILTPKLNPIIGPVGETSKGGTAGQQLGQNLVAGANSKANFLNSGGFSQNNNITLA